MKLRESCRRGAFPSFYLLAVTLVSGMIVLGVIPISSRDGDAKASEPKSVLSVAHVEMVDTELELTLDRSISALRASKQTRKYKDS